VHQHQKFHHYPALAVQVGFKNYLNKRPIKKYGAVGTAHPEWAVPRANETPYKRLLEIFLYSSDKNTSKLLIDRIFIYIYS
jgi:hypothetical protein